eukprot:TRINITY_DN2745_c0_g1_i2.p1 TRINITY_DN2745_c0_g1~~TRINITY_DN2745_c0_g1_i2.p1  ORF type:complete len:779 (-),score=275.68 TRINITY_DN2745_c0_g1_i2:919-3255(-)
MGNTGQKDEMPKNYTKKRSKAVVVEDNNVQGENQNNNNEEKNEMVNLMKDFGRITRITRFTPKEIIYLNNKFKILSDGKKILTFERLSEIREFVSQNKDLCKKLFNIFLLYRMEINDYDVEGIGLLDFLRACSIFSRGSLEEQLPFLFIAMKKENTDYVTRETALNLAEMVKDAFQLSRKISRSGEVLGEAWANIDIVDEIDEKMFERNEKQILKKEDFILKALSTPSALHCLSILERFFHPVTSEMTETNLNDLSLRFLVRLEKTRLPNAINLVCNGIEGQLGVYEKDMKRLYVELSCRQDKQMVDALLTSFGLGFTEDIDLNELNIVCLLHLLKSVLERFPSPLFTFPICIKFTSQFSNDPIVICENILKSLPEENYHTSRRILTTLHRCCFKDNKLYDALSNFFLKCFFRFPDTDGNNYSKNLLLSSQIFKHFLQNINDMAIVNFNVEKKKQAPYFNKTGPSFQKQKNKLTFGDKNKKISAQSKFSGNDFALPSTGVETEEKKNTHKLYIIMQFFLRYLPLSDLLKCRQVNKSWNQIASNSKHLHDYFFVDFSLLLKWMSVGSKRDLAEHFPWIRKGGEKEKKQDFESSSLQFSLTKFSDSKQRSDDYSVRHFVIAVVGSKQSGKSSFISHLGSHIDFSDIRSTKGGRILEGNGKALDLAFSVCLVELEDSNSLFDSNMDELKNLSAAVFIASANDKSFDSLSNLTKEKKVEYPVFHVLNKIDTLSSEELKKVGVKLQTSDSEFSNNNFFPLSLKNQTNSDYFYFQIFKNLSSKK